MTDEWKPPRLLLCWGGGSGESGGPPGEGGGGGMGAEGGMGLGESYGGEGGWSGYAEGGFTSSSGGEGGGTISGGGFEGGTSGTGYSGYEGGGGWAGYSEGGGTISGGGFEGGTSGAGYSGYEAGGGWAGYSNEGGMFSGYGAEGGAGGGAYYGGSLFGDTGGGYAPGTMGYGAGGWGDSSTAGTGLFGGGGTGGGVFASGPFGAPNPGQVGPDFGTSYSPINDTPPALPNAIDVPSRGPGFDPDAPYVAPNAPPTGPGDIGGLGLGGRSGRGDTGEPNINVPEAQRGDLMGPSYGIPNAPANVIEGDPYGRQSEDTRSPFGPSYAPSVQQDISNDSAFGPGNVGDRAAVEQAGRDMLSSTQFNQTLNELGQQYGRDASAFDALGRGMAQYYQDSRDAAMQAQINATMNQDVFDAQARGEQGREGPFSQTSNTAAKGDYQGKTGSIDPSSPAFDPATYQIGRNESDAPISAPSWLSQTTQQTASPSLLAQPGWVTPSLISMLDPGMFVGPPAGPYAGPFAGPDVVGDRSAPNVGPQGQIVANMPWGSTPNAPYAGPFAGPDVVGSREGPQVSNVTAKSDREAVYDQAREALNDRGREMLTQVYQNPRAQEILQEQRAMIDRDLNPVVNVPLPRDNPLTPFERGAVETRLGPERGIDPQNRDAVTRAVERAVVERAAPVVDRPSTRVAVGNERFGAPVTSRSGVNQAAQMAARGDMRGLNALLDQARTAPTQAGRIAALDAINGIISAMRAAGLPNPFGRDPDPNIAAALRQGR